MSAQTLLFSMQVGHRSLGARRLRQTFNERISRRVDACGGQRWRCKRNEKVLVKNSRRKEKRPGTTWLPGLLSIKRSGGRTLWDYCPALQPPPGDGAVSSKPLPSHCGWLVGELPSMRLSMQLWPCKYAAAPRCDGSRLDSMPMDEACASNAPRTATAPWQVRRWMALWRAFMAVSRRWSACS